MNIKLYIAIVFLSARNIFLDLTNSDKNNDAQAAVTNISPDLREKSTPTTKEVYLILPFVIHVLHTY